MACGGIGSGNGRFVQFVVTATETVRNEQYAVVADGGYTAVGSHSVVTIIDGVICYLPIIYKP
ncbi:MAG: hypothetical protein R3E31_17330 [Chloroflexota bacterium]